MNSRCVRKSLRRGRRAAAAWRSETDRGGNYVSVGAGRVLAVITMISGQRRRCTPMTECLLCAGAMCRDTQPLSRSPSPPSGCGGTLRQAQQSEQVGAAVKAWRRGRPRGLQVGWGCRRRADIAAGRGNGSEDIRIAHALAPDGSAHYMRKRARAQVETTAGPPLSRADCRQQFSPMTRPMAVVASACLVDLLAVLARDGDVVLAVHRVSRPRRPPRRRSL